MPSLAGKLRIEPGNRVRTIGMPKDVSLGDLPTGATLLRSGGGTYDVVLFFADDLASLEQGARRALGAVVDGGVLWVAYPKAGKRGTDLKRDTVWPPLTTLGWGPVTQVAIDDTWSALRFRPESRIRRSGSGPRAPRS